jgi:protein involved in ribonucleotide reduction
MTTIADNVRIVYFSSVTENTKKFVDRLGFPAERLPLRRNDPSLTVDYDYVLVIPTYGGGTPEGAVPKQVIKFLNVKSNRDHCLGVIGAGNMNFGEGYLLGAKVAARKLNVPMMYGFELAGLDTDVVKVHNGLTEFFSTRSVDKVRNPDTTIVAQEQLALSLST